MNKYLLGFFFFKDVIYLFIIMRVESIFKIVVINNKLIGVVIAKKGSKLVWIYDSIMQANVQIFFQQLHVGHVSLCLLPTAI